jgi:hypothetical protein
MSLDYDLELATTLSLRQFAREAVDIGRELGLFDAAVTAGQIVTDGATTPLGTWVKVYAPTPPPWPPEVTEPGITTTVQLYKHDRINEQMDDVARVTARMLEWLADD